MINCSTAASQSVSVADESNLQWKRKCDSIKQNWNSTAVDYSTAQPNTAIEVARGDGWLGAVEMMSLLVGNQAKVINSSTLDTEQYM